MKPAIAAVAENKYSQKSKAIDGAFRMLWAHRGLLAAVKYYLIISKFLFLHHFCCYLHSKFHMSSLQNYKFTLFLVFLFSLR